ncbi:hypothetical protein FRC00_003667 [Tulasnella sp. 408]|nr:hypothetical protein FRC00_003667 [Tulasnella sp. 408]
MGTIPKLNLVDYLDDCKEGMIKATEMTIVAPKTIREFRQKIAVGYHLILMLTWKSPAQVTEDQRRYREEAIQAHDWTHCAHKSKSSYQAGEDPVSQWYRVVAQPGFLMRVENVV